MRVNESQSQRPAQAQPRVSPNWQRVQRPPSPSLQLHCTAPLLPGLLLVPPPLSAAPVAEAVRLLALVVRPEGDPTDGRTEADGRWRWDQELPHNDLGPAMSDVTTYLVTNQITPTPPLPHAARHRHVPVHCTAVHTACAAVCVSNFLFDCHSCLPLGWPPTWPIHHQPWSFTARLSPLRLQRIEAEFNSMTHLQTNN